MKERLAYIGLGANIGEPDKQLKEACLHLSSIKTVIASRYSSFYVSKPVGYDGQPDFLNAVLELTLPMSVSAFELFDEMQVIEQAMGRQRDPSNQNAPRVIDCDLLLFGEDCINTEKLIVPHPRMHERLFVLQPLAELNSALQIEQQTGQKVPVQNVILQGDFSGQVVRRIISS